MIFMSFHDIIFKTLITPAGVQIWCTLFTIIFWNNLAGLNSEYVQCTWNAAHLGGPEVWLSFNIYFYKDGTPPAPPSEHHCVYHIWYTQGPGGLGLTHLMIMIISSTHDPLLPRKNSLTPAPPPAKVRVHHFKEPSLLQCIYNYTVQNKLQYVYIREGKFCHNCAMWVRYCKFLMAEAGWGDVDPFPHARLEPAPGPGLRQQTVTWVGQLRSCLVHTIEYCKYRSSHRESTLEGPSAVHSRLCGWCVPA